MAETWIWDRYWHYDRIASCFDGAGAGNYDDSVASGWRSFFAGLPDGARILDLCTGNGAAALIAAEVGRAGTPEAHDKVMVRNTGAVLLDTFSRRGAFDLEQLLAKVDAVRSEILAHRGRLAALVEAALDWAEADLLAQRLRDAGADQAVSMPLSNSDGLVGHVVEARFPSKD